ncbi:MAG: hypothetical protein ACLU37_01475 [Collinsella sp.]
MTHAVLSVHPFAGPSWCFDRLGAHAIASLPGFFMGDTGAQIRQWFNYPNGTSDYLRLLNPNVAQRTSPRGAHGYHRFVRPAGAFTVQQRQRRSCHLHLCSVRHYGRCMAYSISSLRKLGVSLPVRGAILLFFAFMPMFSNYAALLTKDVLLPTRSWCCWYRPSSSWHGLAPSDANVERAGEKARALCAT